MTQNLPHHAFRIAAAWLLAVVALAPAHLGAQFADPYGPPPDRYVGEPVSLSLQDADLVETLRTFSRLGDFNLVLDPAVRGRVTVELKDVPWDQALEAILKIQGLGMDLSDGYLGAAATVRIVPVSKLTQMLKREAQQPTPAPRRNRLEGDLDHVSPRRMARLLESGGYLGDGRAYLDAAGKLVVEADFERLRSVALLIAALDVEGAGDQRFAALVARAQELWNAAP
ncbi:MAG: secretin and TonB N-terminal domain-containing protein [Acidobacteriota bacterium]